MCDDDGWICESALERMERNVVTEFMTENEDNFEEIVMVLVDCDILNRFQVRKLKVRKISMSLNFS